MGKIAVKLLFIQKCPQFSPKLPANNACRLATFSMSGHLQFFGHLNFLYVLIFNVLFIFEVVIIFEVIFLFEVLYNFEVVSFFGLIKNFQFSLNNGLLCRKSGQTFLSIYWHCQIQSIYCITQQTCDTDTYTHILTL